MKFNLFLWTIILVNRPLPMTCQMVPNLQCSKELCHLWRWLIIKCYELNDEFTTIKQIICNILSSTTNTLKMWFTYLNVILISQNSRKSSFTKYFHLHNCTTLSSLPTFDQHHHGFEYFGDSEAKKKWLWFQKVSAKNNSFSLWIKTTWSVFASTTFKVFCFAAHDGIFFRFAVYVRYVIFYARRVCTAYVFLNRWFRENL